MCTGPTFNGETPGTWQVWQPEGIGRWVLDDAVHTKCLIPKHTQDHLLLTIPRHASKDKAMRHFLNTQPMTRSLPVPTEQEDEVNDYRIEQHPAAIDAAEREPINISTCYQMMMSAGTAPNATCAQEHNCYMTEDTRPWSLATFSNYLEELGMLRPTLIDGIVSVGVLREYSGCTLSGAWTSASAGSTLSLNMSDRRANVTWSPTALLNHRFDLAARFDTFDANKDSFLTEDEFKKLSASVAGEVNRTYDLPVFDFLPVSGMSTKTFPPQMKSKAFYVLDSDQDTKLSFDELTSGIARVHVQWDASPTRSPSGAIHFTGNWSIEQGDTFTTKISYLPRLLAALTKEENQQIEATWVTGGKMYGTLDRECTLEMRLMSETIDANGIWDDNLPAPKVFLDFADGKQHRREQLASTPIPPSEMFRRVFTGIAGDSRSNTSVNSRVLELLPSCDEHTISGNECAPGARNLSATARKLFGNGTAPTDTSESNLLDLWQDALTARPYGPDGWNSKTSCVIAMNLTSRTTGRQEHVTRLRYRRHAAMPGRDASWTQALRNARFQGVLPFVDHDAGVSYNRLVDLHVIFDIPRGDDFALVHLDGEEHDTFDMLWFTSSDPKACVALAQVELHAGPVASFLVPDMPGRDSYYVDERELMAHAEAGIIAKCAAKGWFPSRSWTDVVELAVPAANGRLLSSGTLADISREHGPVTSLLVAAGSHSHLYGSARLGHPGLDTTAALISPIRGSEALRFGRAANLDEHGTAPASTRLLASAAISGESLIMLPNARGTVLMQNQRHLALYEDGADDGLTVGESVVYGPLTFKGAVEMAPQPQAAGPAQHLAAVAEFESLFSTADNLSFAGYPQVPFNISERLRVESEVGGQFPLVFNKLGNDRQPRQALAVEEPTKNNTLVLPDAFGTILTTGDLPIYYDKVESPDLLYFGDASFTRRFSSNEPGGPGRAPDVAFGSADSPITVEMNAAVRAGGAAGLVFEGWGDDGRTTRLAADSASGRNILTLPDTDGTVLMTGALPDTLPFLTVLDRVDVLHGETSFGARASGGVHITLGSGIDRSATSLNHPIAGRFPLHFSGRPSPSATAPTARETEQEGGRGPSSGYVAQEPEPDAAPSLQIQVTPSRRRNVITLPDVSGTVITTGNMEALLALPHSPLHRITAASVALTASQMVALGAQASQLLARQSEDSTDSSGQTCFSAPSSKTAHMSKGEGTFAFLDSSHTSEETSAAMPQLEENAFFVRAHGGVRLATGVVHRSGGRAPLEVGAQIPAKGSGWSVLSDRASKVNISQVDDTWVLNALVRVPVHTWQYAGAPEGEGVDGTGVTHMGPMAQDLNEALAPLRLGNPSANSSTPGTADDEFSRIHTSDADGALFSATRGLATQVAAQEDTLEELEEEVHRLAKILQANQDRIARNAHVISSHRKVLAALNLATASLP